METISMLATVLLFAIVGFYLRSGFNLPPTTISFILLVSGFVVVSYTGVTIKLISIMQFSIHLNNCLQGLVLGISARVFLKYLHVKRILK
jgi:hypothetical protein